MRIFAFILFFCTFLTISIYPQEQTKAPSIMDRLKQLEEENQRLTQENLYLKKENLELQARRVEDLEKRVMSERIAQMEVTQLKEQMASIAKKLEDLSGKMKTRNYCYAYSYSGHDMSSSQWTRLNGLSPCKLTTSGGPVKLTMRFTVYGMHHGGIRLVMDGNVVFGTEPTYGLDFVMPNVDNIWQHYSLMRVIPNIPPGPHSFHVEIRAQADGQRFFINSGTESQLYAGFHMFLEEL